MKKNLVFLRNKVYYSKMLIVKQSMIVIGNLKTRVSDLKIKT